MENLKQTKAQPVGENAPGSHVSGNGVSMESLTATQKGKLVLENPVGAPLKTSVDQAGDPGKTAADQRKMEHKPDDFSEY